MSHHFGRSYARVLALCGCVLLAGSVVGACSSRAERAQNYYKQGESYLAKHDFPKARIEFRNALQLNTNMLEAWRGLAQVDEHDHNWGGLAGSLQRVVELDKKDSESRVKLANLYLLGGNLDKALKLANDAAQLKPNDANVLALKAAILFRLKDTDGSKREAAKALKIDPGNASANVVLATEQYLESNFQGALQTLANIESAKQNDLGVLLLKVNIYTRMGNTQQVESLLRQLIKLHPEQQAFRTQLIRFYLAHNRPDDAESELRSVIKANPDDATAELQLADLLLRLKGPEAARSELVSRINAGGKVFPYQVALAKLDFAQNRAADGTALLKKLGDSSIKNDALTAKVTLAQIYVAKKDFSAAEPLISQILKDDSRNIEGLRLRAIVRMNHGKVDDAIADLRSALNDQPQSPQLLETLASAYELSGAVDLAGKAYLDATRYSNFAPAFGLNYVAFLERRGSTAQAENMLAQLAERNPRDIAVLAALAKTKLAQHDWVGAQKVADAIRRLSSKTGIADQISGAALLGQKKLSDSLTLFQDAYNTNPGVEPMAALVNVYVQAHQTDKAQAFLESVLQANPHNAEALVLLGTIQLIKNDQLKAEDDFKAAIKQKPADEAGYRALADLYARQNKVDQAIEVSRTGLQQQPKSFALQLTLAGLLERKGDFNAAISQYQEMLHEQPGSLVVANNLASLLSDHRTDKASLDQARALAQVLKSSPVPQFKDTLGWIEYQEGDYREAVSTLEDASAKLPKVALIRYHLGMSYLAAGDRGKASEQFKKALELSPNDPTLKTKIDAAQQQPPSKSKS